jgi:hypothetical protein
MERLTIRESWESAPLALQDSAIDELRRLGRRLASQKSWWGETEDERDSSAIRCIPVAGGAWTM